jgi:hypothetical protein
MSYILLTITVFLLSLSNLWLWIRLTKLTERFYEFSKETAETFKAVLRALQAVEKHV